MNGPTYSPLAVLGALVALVAVAFAALLFVQGDDATQRLALLFALIGVIVPALLALLRADQAAKATDEASVIAQALNGGFEARVRHANRVTAAETGTAIDAARATADATVASALAHGNPVPPAVLPVLAAVGTIEPVGGPAAGVDTSSSSAVSTPADPPGVDTGGRQP